MELQKNYLPSNKISTVYFGGGTPSLLSGDEVQRIFDRLHKYFEIDERAEITLEANPDDLTKNKLRELRQTPVNRFSIGIQSFFNEDLELMNRAHNAMEAQDCVKMAQDAGFENITIDLIYGTPTMDDVRWKKNLQTAFELQVPHISAYCLTVEPKTALADMVKKKKVANVDDQKSSAQFLMMLEQMKLHGFIQYEISNFGKEGFFSKHNSNYWKGETYLGLGPSAHSFDGTSRQWNVRNNEIYNRGLKEKEPDFIKEILSTDQKYNEYVLTSLRTMWGTSLDKIELNFGSEYLQLAKSESEVYLASGDLELKRNTLFLTEKGKLIADRIASDLFKV
jgi:oxygen-independent coproporphyrinogen-3 oxidase